MNDKEFEYLLKDYNKLQSNWNILKERLKKEDYFEIVEYMNELEGKDNK